MGKKPDMSLNAYSIRKASLCPLKLHYLVQEATETDNDRGFLYKSESRIMLRRALGMLYPGGKETDRNYKAAIRQTRTWMEEPQAVIFGGLTVWGNYRARLPVLIREGNQLTLLQLHGKLWKPAETILQVRSLKSRKLFEYVREAAYKKWILNKLYPDLDVTVQLCFPNPKFRSAIDNLFESLAFGTAKKENIESLFIKVEADLAVNEVLTGSASGSIHPFFKGKPIQKQFEWMGEQIAGTPDDVPFIITDACKLCSYRINTPKSSKGCWESHIEQNYKNPHRHVFDLIGFGNDQEASKRNYFQEEVELPPGVSSFKDIYRHTAGTISIQQRRVLQLLSSRNRELPLHWLKKRLLEKIDEITFPVHFVDFEAATSAIPMEKSGSPYKPVLFQFSCHSLHHDGRLDHHQWLDSNSRGFPHENFVRRLTDIPHINRGVIMQYSPFEKQALTTLNRDFIRNRPHNDSLVLKLRKLIEGSDELKESRFLDMNKLVRDFYYNSEMNDGLGLKQVFFSTIKTSYYLRQRYQEPVNFGGARIHLVKEENGEFVNPYSLIQYDDETIDEGLTAMHAWLHTKTPFCGEKKRSEIHSALRRYCSLDSLALVMIFQHWSHLAGNHGTEQDILVWD